MHILGELWLGETNPNNVVAVRLREKNQNKFTETTLRESKPGPNLFGSTRLSKMRHIFCEEHKAEGNKSYMYAGVQRLSEANANKCSRNQAEGK